MFGALIVAYILVTFVRALLIMVILTISTTRMHERMVEAVVRAKILFFDSNPAGRIFTRFSKDVSVMDLIMPGITVFATFGIFRTITVVMVVCYI